MTLGEVLWMVEGRRRQQIADLSALLAMLANLPAAVWGKEGRAKPSDFDPYARAERRKPAVKTKDLSILKAVFVDRKGFRSPGIPGFRPPGT